MSGRQKTRERERVSSPPEALTLTTKTYPQKKEKKEAAAPGDENESSLASGLSFCFKEIKIVIFSVVKLLPF